MLGDQCLQDKRCCTSFDCHIERRPECFRFDFKNFAPQFDLITSWYDCGVKKRFTVIEAGRKGGNARSFKLSAARRKQIASKAAKARAAKLSPERRKQIAAAAGRKGGRGRSQNA